MEASLTLPLPIELRREIFQHLLIGRNVRDQDGKYHFYTSVLGVNSAFYQEASEMLYKENIFAVIQHAAMNNFGVLAMLQVHAIASPHHLKNHFKAHRICITVQYDQDIPASLEEGLEGQGIVIHADDLKGYIKWLKLSCHEVHQRHMPTILSPTGARPLVLVNMHEGSQPHQLHIRINLRSSVLGRATEKQQRMLMAPFQDVAGAQHVNIIGMNSLVVEMKRHMLPQVVSYQAVGWDLVKTVQSIKKDLDRLSSNTDTTAQRACRGYQWLLASLRITNLSRSAPVRRESHTGWPDALAVIACDIWNSWRVLQVRCQDVGLYHSGTEYVSGWCDLLKERGTTTAVFSSKRRLQQRLLNAALFTFTGQCHQALACFHNAFRFADSVGLTPSREALHDFLIVEKHCNSNRVSSLH